MILVHPTFTPFRTHRTPIANHSPKTCSWVTMGLPYPSALCVCAMMESSAVMESGIMKMEGASVQNGTRTVIGTRTGTLTSTAVAVSSPS